MDNIKKTVPKEYVYDLGVNCNAIAVSDILEIHNYSMNKNNMI